MFSVSFRWIYETVATVSSRELERSVERSQPDRCRLDHGPCLLRSAPRQYGTDRRRPHRSVPVPTWGGTGTERCGMWRACGPVRGCPRGWRSHAAHVGLPSSLGRRAVRPPVTTPGNPRSPTPSRRTPRRTGPTRPAGAGRRCVPGPTRLGRGRASWESSAVPVTAPEPAWAVTGPRTEYSLTVPESVRMSSGPVRPLARTVPDPLTTSRVCRRGQGRRRPAPKTIPGTTQGPDPRCGSGP
jgi:hypothetical protein